MTIPDWATVGAGVGSMLGGAAAAAALWYSRDTVHIARETARSEMYLVITQTLSLDAAQRRNRNVLFGLDPDAWQSWSEEDRSCGLKKGQFMTSLASAS